MTWKSLDINLKEETDYQVLVVVWALILKTVSDTFVGMTSKEKTVVGSLF